MQNASTVNQTEPPIIKSNGYREEVLRCSQASKTAPREGGAIAEP
jgi:hypothetical protein